MGIGNRKVSSLLWFLYFQLVLQQCSSSTYTTISPTQSIRDGDTLTSNDGTFELGFFSPGNSSNRYVGMWYRYVSDKRIVWVANRVNPLKDSSGVLAIGGDGNLVLFDGRRNTLWSTNVSVGSNFSIAVLLDQGNLILRENNASLEDYLWQSFDHPSDTLLLGMKLGKNGVTGEEYFLTSWKNEDDPSPGNFILQNDDQVVQNFIYNGSSRYWRSGLWNGSAFIGIPTLYSAYSRGIRYDSDNHGGGFFSFVTFNNSYFVIMVLSSSGTLTQLNWYKDDNTRWLPAWKAPRNLCNVYGKCGPFGTCNVHGSPICSCLRGFEPKFIEEWSKGVWSNGCMRRSQLQCQRNNTTNSDVFVKVQGIKLPDFSNNLVVADANECEAECVKTCSCVAYAYVMSSTMCLVWWSSTDLIDIEELSYGGELLFLRLAHSELGKKWKIKLLIIVLPIIGLITLGAVVFIFYRLKAKQRGKRRESLELLDLGKPIEIYRDSPSANLQKVDVKKIESHALLAFDFDTVAIATNNFSITNKLGEGGFGPVYKGNLLDGQEVAIKRLSRSSGQGLEEFKNEVTLISKLQHRNLVRLLGYCAEGEEKMLLYEYMANKSLDAYLFDTTKKVLLDWGKRLDIVDGIARGLLYLHRDSRLRVIHRDLKASNILLDEDMNPKISDFGMARIFGGKQLLANTNRVVGTYGYMSPEYAMEGIFSEKSDVFSFGVLLLEIVCSKRNAGFYDPKQFLNLLGYAWQLWNDGKASELMDPMIAADSFCPLDLVIRCIHVGLLCVQENPSDRPTMSSVVVMLGNETTLPTPKQPGFILQRRYLASDSSSQPSGEISINNVTVTTVDEGR